MSVGPSPSTEQLVETARNRAVSLHEQQAAFAQLVAQSQHFVFRRALASLRDIEEARDAAQDAFITAWHCLPQLRDASAFVAWMQRIVTTQCHRRLRRRVREMTSVEAPETLDIDVRRAEDQALIASAIAALPSGERDVTVLFYFLGYKQGEIARMLGLKSGTVGKRLHSARLRIRRGLPASVRREFVRRAWSRTFVEKVRLGIFDEYVGEYRFERRPDLVVSITRRGDSLMSSDGRQRNLLAALSDESLITSHYDGEGRFRRNRQGKVTHFVYYEFGRRLGIARKTRATSHRIDEDDNCQDPRPHPGDQVAGGASITDSCLASHRSRNGHRSPAAEKLPPEARTSGRCAR